ncbi:MAG: Thiol:disulfide interchange protein DsbD [Planctomycetota bacterium]|jgi:YHS domain-containing protein/thioredoxin-related protein
MRFRLFQSTEKFLQPTLFLILVTIILPFRNYGLAYEKKPIEKTLNWLKDYSEALATAVENQRPVWLQFTGPWCPNCHRMDRESFKHPSVIEQLTKHFIPAKISTEDDVELALSFGFTQLPATVLISPDGKILAKHEGFADPEKLKQLTIQAGVPADKLIEFDSKPVEPNLQVAEEPVKSSQDITENDVIDAADKVAEASLPHQSSDMKQDLQQIEGARPLANVASNPLVDAQPGLDAAEILNSREKESVVFKPDLSEPPTEPLGVICPVTLLDSKLELQSDRSVTAVYAGQRYYFANQEAKNRFAKNPERYVPARGGECVVSYVDKRRETTGSSQFPVIYDERIFLCAGSSERENFMNNPSFYADQDVRLSGLCPHCLAAQHDQKKGSSLFQIRFGGSRYLFPDRTHMEAFLKSPLRYLR